MVRGLVYSLWSSSLLRLLARGSHEQPRKIDPYTVPMRKRETVGSDVTLWWVMSRLQ